MTTTLCRAFAIACTFLPACSSVVVPDERFYRLEPPAAAATAADCGGVLRVQDLQLQTGLASDHLQRLHGNRIELVPLARWVAPLDRLVTDALVLGLARARVCELVKGAADPGDETWSLRGRIVDFVQVGAGATRRARVALELWLERDQQVLFRSEFEAEPAIVGEGDDAIVAALSVGLAQVTAGVVQQMRALDLFAQARRERMTLDGPAAAGPAR
ncbi:MAG: membrane integrity-associated transporter subunit PqiC [Planctomycetes bacterium]|nr:membrane integrity-associated transporter subunit PqiC [Planctomycetota bacterium]